MTQQKINLTQKERMLLEDQKSHEEMCIQKYTNYANQASDPQLQQLFRDYASQEQTHLDSINQMLNGTVPSIGQGGQSGQQMGMQSGQGSQSQYGQGNQATMGTTGGNMGGTMGGGQGQTQGSQAGMSNQNDSNLCTDLLMTEKYVSGVYDTAIFEFTNHDARQVLNHIQQEEQQHGEGIYNYMNQHGMYNPQG